MFFHSVFILMFAVVYGEPGADCNVKNCTAMPKHYDELNCKPVTPTGECCPTRFECPDLTSRDKDKCYYQDKIYGNGEKVVLNTTASCVVGCSCRKTEYDAIAQIDCAQIECPDVFEPEMPECVRQFNLDDCCSSMTMCDKAETAKLVKCEFEGSTYVEGQRMYPKDDCYHCLCTKDFEDKPAKENKSCKKIDCGMTLRRASMFQRGCIPIYFKNDRCCPIEFKCPTIKDEIVESETRSAVSSDPDQQCIYGKIKMNIGDQIKHENKCVSCKCTLPPMPHCIQSTDC